MTLSQVQVAGIPKMSCRALEYWHDAKKRQAAFIAQRVLDPLRSLDVIMQLYVSLGGTASSESPIFIKGGAAAWLYLSQQCSILQDAFPQYFTKMEIIADLDFGTSGQTKDVVSKAAQALGWLTDLASECNVVKGFEKKWPRWHVRRDRELGESFDFPERKSLGKGDDRGNGFAIKITCHGGCMDNHSGCQFDLLRLGLAVWCKPLRRATVVSVVDISVSTRLPTTLVMGMRVQSPRSMLRTLRRMAFHETGYQPWLASHGDIKKQIRRFERLVKLSVVEDFKLMRGCMRGDTVIKGLLRRWGKVPELLLMADDQAMRKCAASAPRQMGFFLSVCARACHRAVGDHEMEAYDWWLSNIIFPLVAELIQ